MREADQIRDPDLKVREFPEEGRERKPYKKDRFPVLIGDAIASVMGGKDTFPFKSWAGAADFRYPQAARDFLSSCGSAAEAFFVRPFCLRDGVEFLDEKTARAGVVTLELQVRAANYWVDAVVSTPSFSLAIEIDGIAFHHRSQEAIAADYVRQRRIVLVGYSVIRFTAQEALSRPDESWRQVDLILAKRGKKS